SESHIYRASLDGGEPKPLDNEPGEHGAVFARDHRLWVETTGTMTSATRSIVHAEAGPDVLPSVAEEPGLTPRAENLRDVGPLKFRATIVRPQKLEAGRKLPVLLNVYGGPTARMVKASQDGNLLRQWVADQGFIVVAIDGRGTVDRDHDWERAGAGS